MIYYVKGQLKVFYDFKEKRRNYSEREDVETCIIANNKKEAKQFAKEETAGKRKANWIGTVRVENSNVGFKLLDDLKLIKCGDQLFVTDSFIMYDKSIVPDWYIVVDIVDFPGFSDLQVLDNLIFVSGQNFKEGEWYWYEYEAPGKKRRYIQQIYHEVIEQNGWRLALTSDKPDEPLMILDAEDNKIGMVMPRRG